MDRNRRLVISGGIGSGKSVVAGMFSRTGVHTIDADSVGHAVLAGEAFAVVAGRWPEVVVDDRIDRAALGAIVFGDEGELRVLEEITHPHIFGRIRAEVEDIDGPVAVEIPLLEHRLGRGWQRIVVDSSDELRLGRLVERGVGEDDARARMAAQPSRGRWLAAADIVVPNQGDLEDLAETVERLLTAL